MFHKQREAGHGPPWHQRVAHNCSRCVFILTTVVELLQRFLAGRNHRALRSYEKVPGPSDDNHASALVQPAQNGSEDFWLVRHFPTVHVLIERNRRGRES